MIHSLDDQVKLNNGMGMPGFGLGVWHVRGEDCVNSVTWALETGYRMIDTAEHYQNEDLVGEAVRRSGIPREQLFITTKLWNDDQGYDPALKAFDKSLKKIGLDYIDLYLIHWPIKGKYLDSWRALVRLYEEGRIRAIGVSNFHRHHLEALTNVSDVVPAVNQIELHPLLSQVPLREYCASRNILVEGYSPLGTGTELDHPVIRAIAGQHHKTAAQVILRWSIQNGVVTIPRSTKKEHVFSNADLFDFSLTEEDMVRIDGLNENKRNNTDPDTV
ncbi:aldo/keto reductase [Sporolactobacillus shoreae]|uniref:Aldo/keto reductase n=1 Tax=Sporolactobacillus shoreae TaxID=1465501 RepID=A0A4Z0GPR3_9BACL|nr:aldo/keto reductase [Sporolactobacillus shoreae]TGA98436.1 aldo/keto reductase [Sporolactobacillus shoreae]